MATPAFDAPLLITGGTGFAGSHLTEALLAAGWTNIHLTSFGSSNRPLNFNSTPDAQNVHIHQVDLTDAQATTELFKTIQPAYIYHLASFAAVGGSFEKATEIFDNNITLQHNVLEAFRTITPQSRLLVIGSAEEYGLIQVPEAEKDTFTVTEQTPFRPANPYAVSKVTQDLLGLSYYLSFKLDIVIARPFNHIGERQTPQFVIPAFAKQIVAIERGQQKTIQVGNLDAVRDFTDVKDMVQAYILLMAKGQAGEAYNIGSGQGRTVRAMLDELCGLSTTSVTVETDPQRLRPIDLPRLVANSDKIHALGWTAQIPMAETLARVLAYWRSQPAETESHS